MDAYVLHGINHFGIESIKNPTPGFGEVVIQVKAAGICGSDIPRIYKTGTYAYPLVPGHEFSGVIIEVGEGVDLSWMGKRVGVSPLIPCKKCILCQKKQYELCQQYGYVGSRADGAFAQYVKVPEWNLMTLPQSVSFEQGAMLEPMAVAVHAMRRCTLKKDEKVAICGLGTIGLLLAMFLHEYGIENITVIGNKNIQKEKILDLGLSEDCWRDARLGDMDEAHLSYEADVFFDCVGSNEVLLQAIHHTTAGGRIVVVGNPASDMMVDRTTYWKILRKQLTVVGTWNSSYTRELTDDWYYVMERLALGIISPQKIISHRMNFESLIQGVELMRDKTQEYIKVMGIFS